MHILRSSWVLAGPYELSVPHASGSLWALPSVPHTFRSPNTIIRNSLTLYEAHTRCTQLNTMFHLEFTFLIFYTLFTAYANFAPHTNTLRSSAHFYTLDTLPAAFEYFCAIRSRLIYFLHIYRSSHN